jgi:hypothetical protein
MGGRRQKWRENPPFLVAQIAAIAQMVAVVPRSGFGRPHRRLQEKVRFSTDSIGLPKFKVQPCVSRQPLKQRTEKGKHYGLLTAKYLDVLEALLWSFHNARSGLCFPSLEKIAEKAKCSRSTVWPEVTERRSGTHKGTKPER